MTTAPSASLVLLAQADGLLSRGDQVGRQALRIACWLTRAALEQRVDELLAAKGWAADRATMRTRMSCLESAYVDEPELVARAEYAWAALSRVCHQHAYELGPTIIEARQLGTVVAELGTQPNSPRSTG